LCHAKTAPVEEAIDFNNFFPEAAKPAAIRKRWADMHGAEPLEDENRHKSELAHQKAEPPSMAAQDIANALPAVVPLQSVPQHLANSPPQSLQLVPLAGVPVDPQPPPVAGIHVVSVQSTVYAPWWLQCLCCYAWFWTTSTTGYIKVQCKPLVTVIHNCVLPISSIVLLSSLGFVCISVISQFEDMANIDMQRTAQGIAHSIEQSLHSAMAPNSVNSLQSSNGTIVLPANPSPGTLSVLLSSLTALGR